jgi:predicted metal-dependent enzyme (double-stranded beta helix superfamily)
MHDALANHIVGWANRVLSHVVDNVAGGADAAVLAKTLAKAPWWEGCPRAADLFKAGSAHAYRRLPLGEGSSSAYSALLIAWPAGHATPVHDHDSLWGIELVLDGVLEVEAFSLSIQPKPQLVSQGARLLGIGDHTTFSDRDYAQRCRNLSSRLPALSLHIYGGELTTYSAFHRDASGSWDSVSHRAVREPALT